MNKLFYAVLLMAGVFAACSSDPEEGAQIYLTEARVMMQARQYDAARDTIESLRKRFPTAFNTRRQAMLVLDSLEFLAAEDSLQSCVDSVKATELNMRATFYRRRLVEDMKKVGGKVQSAEGSDL